MLRAARTVPGAAAATRHSGAQNEKKNNLAGYYYLENLAVDSDCIHQFAEPSLYQSLGAPYFHYGLVYSLLIR